MRALSSAQSKVTPLARHLRAGKVYRREDLAPYSTSIDRELQLAAGRRSKAAQGLYYVPRKSVFGDAPPTKEEMLATFLYESQYRETAALYYAGQIPFGEILDRIRRHIRQL